MSFRIFHAGSGISSIPDLCPIHAEGTDVLSGCSVMQATLAPSMNASQNTQGLQFANSSMLQTVVIISDLVTFTDGPSMHHGMPKAAVKQHHDSCVVLYKFLRLLAVVYSFHLVSSESCTVHLV